MSIETIKNLAAKFGSIFGLNILIDADSNPFLQKGNSTNGAALVEITQCANSLTLTSNVAVQIPALTKSFQAVATATGAVSANVSILVSNDNTNYIEVAILSLSGTNTAVDYVSMQSAFKYTKAVVSNLTGAGAACVVTVGY